MAHDVWRLCERFNTRKTGFLANVNYVTFAICHRPFVCRLCLSSVTLVRPTQPVEILGNFFTV